MKVLTSEDAHLRTVSTHVLLEDLKGPKTQKLFDELIEIMTAERGIGIAAPQVGICKRLIIVSTKNGIEAFANPKMISASLRKVDSEEGCLSIPGVIGKVKRHASIKIKALDRYGKRIQRKATGLEAIIFQHEIDHLDGILFIDRIEGSSQVSRL